MSEVPEITRNKDDLEIVNGTTWNENIVCTRDVITANGYRVLLLQQPYGAIAQTPGWVRLLLLPVPIQFIMPLNF